MSRNEIVNETSLYCWCGMGLGVLDLSTLAGGVLGISSDGDDRMEPKVKTQKNPWTKN